jgi:hypothetical protein
MAAPAIVLGVGSIEHEGWRCERNRSQGGSLPSRLAEQLLMQWHRSPDAHRVVA